MICVYSAPAPATSRDCADLAGVDMIPEGIYVEWHDDSETEEAGTDNVASRLRRCLLTRQRQPIEAAKRADIQREFPRGSCHL